MKSMMQRDSGLGMTPAASLAPGSRSNFSQVTMA